MKTAFSVVIITVSFLLSNCTPSNTVQPLQGDWFLKAEFEGAGRGAAASFTIGNVAYVGTGLDASDNSLKDFWMYDPQRNSWTQKANFPGEARSEAVGFSIGSKGYVGTGLTSLQNTLLRDFYEYNPATNTWKRIADFGGTARRSTIAFTLDLQGFVGTGFDGNEQGDVWAYNPTSDSWTRKADFGGNARVGATSFVVDNAAYVGIGSQQSVEQTDFWRYNSATNTWTKRRDLPNINGLGIYGVGFAIDKTGYFVTNGKAIWAYDPSDDTWAQKALFEGAQRTKAVGFRLGSKGYVTMGLNGNSRFDDIWEFDPAY